MSKYTPVLLKKARDEFESLKYDFQNASTLYSLQAACQKLMEIVEYILHDSILDAPVAPQAAPPAPAPVPVAIPTVRATLQRPTLATDLPQPGSAPRLPGASAPEIPGMADVAVQAGVANVFVTSQGTKVVGPTGVTAALPPGAPVSLADVSGVPELPPPPEDGVNVVLPPGGAELSPEMASLLHRTT